MWKIVLEKKTYIKSSVWPQSKPLNDVIEKTLENKEVGSVNFFDVTLLLP